MLRFPCLVLLLGVLGFGLGVAPASASSIGFHCVTGGSAADCATGEAQLQIEFVDAGSNAVAVVLRNLGPEASSIFEVFFSESEYLASVTSVTDEALISYEIGVDPAGLPGAPEIGWHLGVTGRPERMAGPGEELTILLAVNGITAAGLEELIYHGEIVVGVHVIEFASGGAEGFVSGPATVPEPAAGLLLGLAAIGGLAIGRRRSQD